MDTIKKDQINRIDSEAGVIASLIHNPDLYFSAEQLKPKHFTDTQNASVYMAITMMAHEGIQDADPYMVLEILNKNEETRKYAEPLNLESLNELFEMSDVLARSTSEEYKILAGNVLDAAFRRDTISSLSECISCCEDSNANDIKKLISQKVDNVIAEYSTAEDIPEIGEIVDDLWEDIVKHQDGNDTGIKLKFPTLEQFVKIEPSELICICASAKGGKSMFMMNEAVDILRQGKSVMYIDSELSSRLFLCRMLSHLTGIEFGRIRSGNYSEFEAKKIAGQLGWIKRQRLTHVYMPIFDMDVIYSSVKKIHHKYAPLDVLIVDYLKPTDSSGDAYSVYSELGKLTNMIKNELLGTLNIAGLAAAQLTSGNKLADSAKIVRNASTIIKLIDKTPDEIEVDGPECGNKKMIVTQNRNGMQHPEGEYIDVMFYGNVCTFAEAKQHTTENPY